MHRKRNFNVRVPLALPVPRNRGVFTGIASGTLFQRAARVSAFTLLEVLLALALSALVFVAIGMAINVHLRLLDVGRTKVEEAQIARAIMQYIARDLHGTVPYNANKNSSSSSSSSSSSTGALSTTGGLTATSPSNTQAETSTEGTDATETDRTSDLVNSSVQSTPGLYGNANQMQVDISRLPRADQSMSLMYQTDPSMTNADQLSDVKTVTYYTANNDTSLTQTAVGGTNNNTVGLYRRETSRASASFAALQGISDLSNQYLKPLAPEVEAIQFQYYDGSQWLDEWDSVSYSALPVAVQVSISITPQHPRNLTNIQPIIYRLIVDIPAAKQSTSGSTSTQ
jgi:hypothetical protein